MPELPEVETVVRSIARVVGRRVVSAEFRCVRILCGDADSMSAALAGKRIRGVARRGKFILLELDGGHPTLLGIPAEDVEVGVDQVQGLRALVGVESQNPGQDKRWQRLGQALDEICMPFGENRCQQVRDGRSDQRLIAENGFRVEVRVQDFSVGRMLRRIDLHWGDRGAGTRCGHHDALGDAENRVIPRAGDNVIELRDRPESAMRLTPADRAALQHGRQHFVLHWRKARIVRIEIRLCRRGRH